MFSNYLNTFFALQMCISRNFEKLNVSTPAARPLEVRRLRAIISSVIVHLFVVLDIAEKILKLQPKRL